MTTRKLENCTKIIRKNNSLYLYLPPISKHVQKNLAWNEIPNQKSTWQLITIFSFYKKVMIFTKFLVVLFYFENISNSPRIPLRGYIRESVLMFAFLVMEPMFFKHNWIQTVLRSNLQHGIITYCWVQN